MTPEERAVQASLDELLEEWHRVVGSLGTEAASQRERAERAELALTRWRSEALAAAERHPVEVADEHLLGRVLFWRTAAWSAGISGGLLGFVIGWWA